MGRLGNGMANFNSQPSTAAPSPTDEVAPSPLSDAGGDHLMSGFENTSDAFAAVSNQAVCGGMGAASSVGTGAVRAASTPAFPLGAQNRKEHDATQGAGETMMPPSSKKNFSRVNRPIPTEKVGLIAVRDRELAANYSTKDAFLNVLFCIPNAMRLPVHEERMIASWHLCLVRDYL